MHKIIVLFEENKIVFSMLVLNFTMTILCKILYYKNHICFVFSNYKYYKCLDNEVWSFFPQKFLLNPSINCFSKLASASLWQYFPKIIDPKSRSHSQFFPKKLTSNLFLFQIAFFLWNILFQFILNKVLANLFHFTWSTKKLT